MSWVDDCYTISLQYLMFIIENGVLLGSIDICLEKCICVFFIYFIIIRDIGYRLYNLHTIDDNLTFVVWQIYQIYIIHETSQAMFPLKRCIIIFLETKLLEMNTNNY